jgi:hypothetical protein
MNAVGVRAGRRAPAPTREELRRQLLALVLALVLVWYTFVVPANAASGGYAAPDDEGHDGEVRGVGGALKDEGKGGEKVKAGPADELDWPEYIYP